MLTPSYASTVECWKLDNRETLRRSGKCKPNGNVIDRLFVPKILLVVLLCCKLVFDAESCNMVDLDELVQKKFCAFPGSLCKYLLKFLLNKYKYETHVQYFRIY